MDFRKMECFIALFEEKNFTKAAERLYMAQSSLSAQIKAIEEEIGCSLINRSNRRDLFFTDDAQYFYDFCLETTISYDNLLKRLTDKSENPIKNIGLFYSSRLETWTQTVSKFNENSEKANYGIIFSYGQEKIDQLLNGETFITLSIRNAELDKMGYIYVPRHYDTQALGIPYHHPLAKKDEITAEDLKDLVIHVISPKRTKADEGVISTLINKYGLKPSNFHYENKIGDLHFVTKTKNAVIMMPKDLLPQNCKILPLSFDECFKIQYGWYFKEYTDDVKWVLENL